MAQVQGVTSIVFQKSQGVEILPEFELATSSLIVQFVKRHLGIGCVVRDFATEALSEESVREVKLNPPLPKRNICILRRKSIVSKASQKLLDLILP